jgi:hypothetical protein
MSFDIVPKDALSVCWMADFGGYSAAVPIFPPLHESRKPSRPSFKATTKSRGCEKWKPNFHGTYLVAVHMGFMETISSLYVAAVANLPCLLNRQVYLSGRQVNSRSHQLSHHFPG